MDLVAVNISRASNICSGQGVASAVCYITQFVVFYIFYYPKFFDILNPGRTQIKFFIPQGNVSSLDVSTNADVTDAVTLKIVAGNHEYSTIDNTIQVKDGTTEHVECSGRGVCDYTSGTCECFNNFLSSDGVGAAGSRGDCGYFFWELDNYPTDLFCPYAINLDTNETELCSGHGTCSVGSCICDAGYG